MMCSVANNYALTVSGSSVCNMVEKNIYKGLCLHHLSANQVVGQSVFHMQWLQCPLNSFPGTHLESRTCLCAHDS
ncbi:unnamed protein product [Urochloa humidicola]